MKDNSLRKILYEDHRINSFEREREGGEGTRVPLGGLESPAFVEFLLLLSLLFCEESYDRALKVNLVLYVVFLGKLTEVPNRFLLYDKLTNEEDDDEEDEVCSASNAGVAVNEDI